MNRPRLLALGLGLLLAGCAPRAMVKPLAAGAPGPGAAAAAPAAAGPKAAPERLRPADENQPVKVTSDRLSYSHEGQVSVFTGRVRVLQAQSRLEAPYLEVRSADGAALARDNVRYIDGERGVTITSQELDYKENLENAVARGHARLDTHDDQGLAIRVQSDRLEWRAKARQARADGSVRVTYQDATVTAGTMLYRQLEDNVDFGSATGTAAEKPRIVKSGDIVSGSLLALDLKDRVYAARGQAEALFLLRPLGDQAGTHRKVSP